MSTEVKRIPLDRRVCVVQTDRIDLRAERGALVLPLIGLLIGLLLFFGIILYATDLPTGVLVIMLLGAVLITPISGMGFVYSLVGASVVVEKDKESVRFQQGLIGLGIGTVELIPFWKIEHIDVADCPLGDLAPSGLRPPLDLRAWDVILVKKSGKRLSIGQVISANTNELIDEGFDRALDAAEAIAAMTGTSVVITAAIEDAQAETSPASVAPVAQPDDARNAEPAAGSSA